MTVEYIVYTSKNPRKVAFNSIEAAADALCLDIAMTDNRRERIIQQLKRGGHCLVTSGNDTGEIRPRKKHNDNV